MSIRATEYVRDVAAREAGCSGSRLVLTMLAIGANASCGCTFGGGWLVESTGLHERSVRRHLEHLVDRGLIDVRRRPGRAHVVRFPTGTFIHNTGHRCPGCKAWSTAEPRTPVSDTPDTGVHDPGHGCPPYLEEKREGKQGATNTGAHGPLSRAERQRLISLGRLHASEHAS